MTRPASVTTALSMLREARGEARIPDRMAWDLALYVTRLESAAVRVFREALDDAEGAPGTVALADLRDALPSPAQAMQGGLGRAPLSRDHRALPDEMTHYPAAGGTGMPCGRKTMCPGVCRCVQW